MKDSVTQSNGPAQPAKPNQLAPISERKLKANRENAKKSTGPKTLRGKTNSRRNALKHGFFARELLRDYPVETEDRKGFERLLKGLMQRYEPVGLAEELEVESIAISQWRRVRAWRAENAEVRIANLNSFFETWRCRPLMPSARYAPIIPLMADAEKEFIETGTFSAGLGEKLLAIDPSDFPQEIWQECGDFVADVLHGKVRPGGGLILAIPHSAEQRLLFTRFWQTRGTLRFLQDTEEQIFQDVLNLRYARGGIPSAEVLDRILRYEATIERSLNRALNRLERLQRGRKGEPGVPPLSVQLTQ